MNKSYLLPAILTALALLTLYHQDSQKGVYSFQQFKTDFGKHYAQEGEEEYRKTIFLRNLVKI